MIVFLVILGIVLYLSIAAASLGLIEASNRHRRIMQESATDEILAFLCFHLSSVRWSAEVSRVEY